jgi:hypothetical protein
MIDNHGYVFGPSSDDDGIAAVAGSFSGLHMDRGIEGITRRARTLSWRRRAVPATAAVAFAAAVGAVVVASPGHAPAPAAAVANPAAATTGNLELTGFTVQKDVSTGIITVTVKNFDNPAGLVAALAKDGVKVQVQYDNNLPSKVVEKEGPMMGYNGDTYFWGAPWTKEPDGTYKIIINVKALGPSRVQPIVITKGY